MTFDDDVGMIYLEREGKGFQEGYKQLMYLKIPCKIT
jgi:hypothetical protein